MYQMSETARNARLAAYETHVGTAPILRLYDLTGSAPANCAASITATLVAEATLPSDWMGTPSGGVADLAGTWQDTSANATGLVDFWRLWASDGTTCHGQGYVAENWQASKAYLVGQQVKNGSDLYRCITAGTSASSGGPTGTGADITDGTAHWLYVAGGVEMIMVNTSVNAGQPVSITQFQLTEGNA